AERAPARHGQHRHLLRVPARPAPLGRVGAWDVAPSVPRFVIMRVVPRGLDSRRLPRSSLLVRAGGAYSARASMTRRDGPLSTPVTLLFTDLINSTELLQRVGDERAETRRCPGRLSPRLRGEKLLIPRTLLFS